MIEKLDEICFEIYFDFLLFVFSNKSCLRVFKSKPENSFLEIERKKIKIELTFHSEPEFLILVFFQRTGSSGVLFQINF